MKEIYNFYGLNNLVNEDYKKMPNSIRIRKGNTAQKIAIAEIIFDFTFCFFRGIVYDLIMLFLIPLAFCIIGLGYWYVEEGICNIGTYTLYKEDGKKDVRIHDMGLYITILLVKYSIVFLWYNRIEGLLNTRKFTGALLELVIGIFPGIFVIGAISGIIFGSIVFGISHKKIRNNLKEIEEYNAKLNCLKENMQKYNSLETIKNQELIDRMEDSIKYYNAGDYESALIKVCHVLEVYLSEKLISEKIVFTNEKEINIYYFIWYFEKKGIASNITERLRTMCYICDFGTRSPERKSVKKGKAEAAINEMLDILKEDCKIFDSNIKYFNKLKEKMKLYVKRANEFNERNNKKDAMSNLRNALECLIDGYMRCNHLICTYGYANNSTGYVDILFDKGVITGKTKKNMHYILTIVNRRKCNSVKQEDINEILQKLKMEIQVYKEAIADNSEKRYVEWRTDSSIINEEDSYEEDYDEEELEEEYHRIFKTDDDIYNDSYEEDTEDFYDQYDEEYHTAYELTHPDAYWDMDRFNDPNRLFDVENYYGP